MADLLTAHRATSVPLDFCCSGWEAAQALTLSWQSLPGVSKSHCACFQHLSLWYICFPGFPILPKWLALGVASGQQRRGQEASEGTWSLETEKTSCKLSSCASQLLLRVKLQI